MKPVPLPLRAVAALLCLCLAGWGARADEPDPPPVNVVLVHGILDTGALFDPMVGRLEAAGCRCFAPTLRPNTCALGVHDLAGKLSAQIDRRFGPRAPFVLVGFSLGAVVARDYVQTLAARGRVRGAFLISAPNHGTLWACLCPRGGLRDLAIGSPFLRRLNADDRAWTGIAVRSYWTPFDLMIVPAASSRWPVGETRCVACALHPWMVRNPVVLADITARIGRLREVGQVPAKNGEIR